MSDQDQPVTPEQEAHLRRLLADARHDEPVPGDVAARLDRVLEHLADDDLAGVEPAAGPTDTTDTGTASKVVDLAARRRRRVRALLVAAVAIVVVGVGVGRLVGPDDRGVDRSSAGEEAGSAADAPERGSAPPDDLTVTEDDGDGSADSSTPSAVPTQAPPTAVQAPGAGADEKAALPRITRQSFPRDAARLQDRPGVESVEGARVRSSRLSADPAFACASADWGAGRLVAVLYTRLPAVLAYRPAPGDTQVVDLLRCGTGDVVRSTTLALP